MLIFLLIALLLIASVLSILRANGHRSDAISDPYADYIENVRTLLEKEFDNVVVLEAFNLKNGDEIIDSMFIAKTEQDIIIGCIHTYEDDGKNIL